jgi:hypothetical protein
MHEWMIEIGTASDFRPIERWIWGNDDIAIMGFGHNYDLIREALPDDERTALDTFYGPIRTATFRPKHVLSSDFDCLLLKALGVDFAFSPQQCWQMREIGYYDPFVAHFARAYKNPSGIMHFTQPNALIDSFPNCDFHCIRVREFRGLFKCCVF